MEETAKAHGVALHGAWVSMVAHTFFILVDAPGAPAIQDYILEIGLHSRNTVTMYPAVTLQEAIASFSSSEVQCLFHTKAIKARKGAIFDGFRALTTATQ